MCVSVYTKKVYYKLLVSGENRKRGVENCVREKERERVSQWRGERVRARALVSENWRIVDVYSALCIAICVCVYML